VFVSLAAALVAAFCYGLGAVMQAIAVRASSRRPAMAAAGEAGRVDPSLVIRMLRQWPFLVSIVIDLFGFVCQLIALRRLPLFEVQVIIAANLAVTAVFASWLMHAMLSAREWAAVIAVVIGVGLLGASAGAQGAVTVGVDFHLALIAALVAIAAAGVVAARLPSRLRTPVLGAFAGMGYAVLAVCARVLPGLAPAQLVKSPAAYTLAAAGVISFMLYASALESGSVTVATAAVILVETVPPAIVGVTLLGDTTRPGMTGLAVAGFVLALVSAVALARFGEAGVDKAPARQGPQLLSPATAPSPAPGWRGQAERAGPESEPGTGATDSAEEIARQASPPARAHVAGPFRAPGSDTARAAEAPAQDESAGADRRLDSSRRRPG